MKESRLLPPPCFGIRCFISTFKFSVMLLMLMRVTMSRTADTVISLGVKNEQQCQLSGPWPEERVEHVLAE